MMMVHVTVPVPVRMGVNVNWIQVGNVLVNALARTVRYPHSVLMVANVQVIVVRFVKQGLRQSGKTVNASAQSILVENPQPVPQVNLYHSSDSTLFWVLFMPFMSHFTT